MHESVGASGGLGFIWNNRKVSLDILTSKNNWISGLAHSVKSDIKFILFNIYEPISDLEKKLVWNDISQYMENLQNIPIILGGDFNTILNLNEKIGGIQQISQSMKEFKEWC